MIGVIADLSEHAAVGEFFELFKTPWEFYRDNRQYEVLLCTEYKVLNDHNVKLVLFYAGRALAIDTEQKIAIATRRVNCALTYKGARIPIYGDCVTFEEPGEGLLLEVESQRAAMHQHRSRAAVVVRMGYDLFREVGTLLTTGQPAAHAGVPTLDLHIALLRDLIVAHGISLVEIPPVPDGYRFIACLTHDVDHPSIANHKWDHTIFGFLYRAVFGSLGNLLRRQISVKILLVNWAAALKLPVVYLGLAKDFWAGFEDRYLEVENGLRSTFFVIPFRDRPGKNSEGGVAPRFRAAGYCAREIEGAIRKIMAAGCEVGLHGIDAWLDSSRAHEELKEIRNLTRISEIGVRMHWLYFDQQSPIALERAGTAYDSTIGYRETVGYRAGTTQAYKPLEAVRLLELPIHVMDTALFYPAYLGLSERQAIPLLHRMVDKVVEFGGCITINWHDRSLSPERNWDVSYRDLIQELKNRGAWFATAGQATSWFQMRRSVVFEEDRIEGGEGCFRIAANHSDNLPGLRMRTYKLMEPREPGPQGPEAYVDKAISGSCDNSAAALSAN